MYMRVKQYLVSNCPTRTSTIFSPISQGFNRGDDNQNNTYLAVVDAKERVLSNLWAVELGNEPDGMEALVASPRHIHI